MYKFLGIVKTNGMEYCYYVEQFDIGEYVNSPLVKDVQYVVCGDRIIVAAMTEAIFLRSDREKLMQEIGNSLLSRFDSVIVSLDTEIYYKAMLNKFTYNELHETALNRGNSQTFTR